MFTRRNKVISVVLLAVIAILLSGCSKEIEVKLYIDDELYHEFTPIEGKEYHLSKPEKDGMVFVGWEDDGTYYLSDVVFTESIELHAKFEDPNEVFILNDDPVLDNTIYISGYNGESTVLIVPVMINDKYVRGVNFKQQDKDILLEEVHVPVDATVSSYAFDGASELRRFEFYGTFQFDYETVISAAQYDEYLEEYATECVITSGSEEEGSWTFKEGCPIKEIIRKTASVIFEGVEYYSYEAILDLNHADIDAPMLVGSVFRNAEKLESVVLVESKYFFADSFQGCPNLTSVEFVNDSGMYIVSNGVLLSKDAKTLIFYPGGLAHTEYKVPDTVETLGLNAFISADRIKKLIIPDTVETYNNALSNGLLGLEEFVLEGDHEELSVVEGVLYNDNELIKYPAMKPGTSFTLPEGVDEINSFAFQGNKYLEEIDLGDELKFIGYNAFMSVESLTSLDIPESVEVVQGAIIDQSSVREITFHRGSGYEFVTITPEPLTRDRDLITIYVPDDSIQDYMSSRMGQYHSENIKKVSEKE